MSRCRVCKRKLSNKLSVKRGIGKECYRKLKKGYSGVQIKQLEKVSKLKKKLEII